jgi:hypothetical protein
MTKNLSESDEDLAARQPGHGDKIPILFLVLTLGLIALLFLDYNRMKALRGDLVQKTLERRGIQLDTLVGRCQLYKEAGLADLKHRFFLLNKAKKPAPTSLKFSRVMGASYGNGLDRAAVEVTSSGNNRYAVTIVGSVNLNVYNFGNPGSQGRLPEEQWNQAAKVTLKAKFQLKAGEIVNWKVISEDSWHQPLPEPSEGEL